MQKLRDTDQELINHWYIIALSAEVKAGEKIARTIYDKSYVVFRNEENSVGVLEDRCLHRGAQLSKGTCEKNYLRCPYHGWAYNSDGRLVDIPSEGPDCAASVKEKKWFAPILPMVEQDGCIWVWPGDPEKKTSLPPWRFPFFGEKKWAQYFMITEFQDGVTRLVQNFMDVPHTVYVHKKWFRNRRLLKVPIDVDVKNGRVKVTYHQPNDSIGFMEAVLNPKKEPMVHTDEFIFPNITRVDYIFGKFGFIINSQCTPVSSYQTRVYTWITYRVGFFTAWLKPFMRYYTRQVILQDVKIMKNLGDNFKVFGPMKYKSTAADELHIAIDRMRELGQTQPTLVYEPNYRHAREFWI